MKIYSSSQRRGKEARLDQFIGKDLWIAIGYNQLSWFIRILDKVGVGTPTYIVNRLGYNDVFEGYLSQGFIDLNEVMSRKYTMPMKVICTYFDDDFELYTTEELLEIIHTAGGNR